MQKNENNTETKEEIKVIPIAQEFFSEYSLYTPIEFDLKNEQDLEKIGKLINPKENIDIYCTKCNNNSIFKNKHYTNEYEQWRASYNGYTYLELLQKMIRNYDNKVTTLEFECTRKENDFHTIFFSVLISDNKLYKIGQYPSLATLQVKNVKEYNKVLSKEKFSEFKRAIGLHSHGIGIGSFVYLRRVIEDLIEDAHKKAKKDTKFNENDYTTNKVVEKIKMLRGFIPDFLIENARLYSIISKGIHELTEEECNEIFPFIKASIEIILDEKISQQKLEESKKKLSSTLNSLELRYK